MAPDNELERWTSELQSLDWSRRVRACRELGRLGDERAAPHVLPLLGHWSKSVRSAARDALTDVGWGDALHAVDLVRKGDPAGMDAIELRRGRHDMRAVDIMLAPGRGADPNAVHTWDSRIDRALRRLCAGTKPDEWLCRECLARFADSGRPHVPPLVLGSCWLAFASVQILGIPAGFVVAAIVVPSLLALATMYSACNAAVCRVCGKAAHGVPGVKQVVAVLDTGKGAELVIESGIARVNWRAHLEPFDFERVEIVDADDSEVERLCIWVGNQTDLRERCHGLPCWVASDCHLPANTMNLLRSTFGEVTVAGCER